MINKNVINELTNYEYAKPTHITMALGHFNGQYFAKLSSANLIAKQKIKAIDEKSLWSSISSRCHLIIDPSFASGSLLGILSLMSLYDVIEA